MTKNIVEILDEFQRAKGIDNRLVVYDYNVEERNSRLCVDFYTSLSSVAQAVGELLATTQVIHAAHADVSIHILPDASVGERKLGVCNIGTASLYRSSSFHDEQINQILLGESFDVLQVRGSQWIRIRLHRDGYLGWLNTSQVVLMLDDEFGGWKKLQRCRCESHISYVMERPAADARTIRDAVIGVYLPVAARRNSWRKVLLPDGVWGWMRSSKLSSRDISSKKISASRIIRTAETFLGYPYQWGGRSPKGFDCSGLVQTVFSINGINLPRDAAQQWSEGKEIGSDLKELEKGDLVFFGESSPETVSHVGISTGKDGVFIHSRGYVRYDSLEPKSKIFNNQLASIYIGARRIAGVG